MTHIESAGALLLQIMALPLFPRVTFFGWTLIGSRCILGFGDIGTPTPTPLIVEGLLNNHRRSEIFIKNVRISKTKLRTWISARGDKISVHV